MENTLQLYGEINELTSEMILSQDDTDFEARFGFLEKEVFKKVNEILDFNMEKY